MKVTKATKGETEAQLETRARVALLKALPWLDGKEIKQQVSFTIRFGHAVIHVDGKEREHVTGRADILVTANGAPTLVLELKRPELGINEDDVEQGLSYARILHSIPDRHWCWRRTARRAVWSRRTPEWTGAPRPRMRAQTGPSPLS
ncbi:type I restriction enzyme HsdR N-terminal domain-containing protein [Roseicyclus salinarum]|uniref:type I restriction enzyme HsdR N-terminal domain-containing protein n=1 Tax=Roseicyclus salinarum TaxID=3036773 RepID=UPI0024151458|nr:hypothetical protein [Roseibacterium sp. SDUM158017]